VKRGSKAEQLELYIKKCYKNLKSVSVCVFQCPGVYLGHPVPGGYKYRGLAFQVGGVSRIGTIKYGLESRGTQTRAGLHWRGPAATVNYRPVLSSERALQNNKPATKKISRRKKNWSRALMVA
jgi:hypothetical protein